MNTSASIFIKRQGDGAFVAPTVFYSQMDCLVVNAEPVTPLSMGKTNPIMLNENILSCIVVLFFPGSPTNVSLLVMFAVIYAIYAVIWCWPEAYTINNICDAFKPAFDSASTVISIAFVLWIIAAVKNIYPRHILIRSSKSVCNIRFNYPLSKVTSTRNNFATFYVIEKYNFLISALTSEKKFPYFLPRWEDVFFCLTDYSEKPKSIARINYKFLHWKSLISGLSLLKSVEGRVMNPAFRELPYPHSNYNMS